MTKDPTEFTSFFYGSGSASGNSWGEEVCYLGDEQWLLLLADDEAFSSSPVSREEPEQRSTASLVSAVLDWDEIDMISGDEGCRVRGLLGIAKEVGAIECVALLEEELSENLGSVESDSFIQAITGVIGEHWLGVITERGKGTMDFPNESGVTMVHLDDEEVRVQLSHEQQEIIYDLRHRG